MPRHRQRSATPLYDPRFEHDACGVGFVADAGGRSRARVLPLALAGLAALAHRGAFGADGESSDGAGISLPLDASLLGCLDAAERAADRPAVVMLFLPRGRTAERAARDARGARLRRGRPPDRRLAARADGPAGAGRGGRRVAPGRGPGHRRPVRPRSAQRRPAPHRRRLRAAPRRRPTPAGDGGPGRRRRRGRAVRALGVVSDDRLQGPRRRRPPGRALSGPARARRGRLRDLPPALRDEHPSGLAARPAVPLDRPQRRDQHGARQSRAGPRPRARRRWPARSPPSSSPPARCSPRTAPTRCRSTRAWSC